MAVTKGHGNPNWTRDETVLALDLYLSCEGAIPSKSDERVKNLSELLRSFPYHSFSARKESFRNPDGVAFKLQNIRNVATGKGLGNVSNMDKRIWNELGDKPEKVKELTALICSGIKINNEIGDQAETLEDFNEGRIVTETHLKRERNPNIRKRLLESRIQSDELKCELCNCPPIQNFLKLLNPCLKHTTSYRSLRHLNGLPSLKTWRFFVQIVTACFTK